VVLPEQERRGSAVSADFQRALTQQILRTELIRIKALIGTAVLIGSLIFIIHVLDPMRYRSYGTAASIRASSSSSWSVRSVRTLVHHVIQRHLGKDHDLPVYRRYMGGWSKPDATLALAMHIDSMGPVDALASRCR